MFNHLLRPVSKLKLSAIVTNTAKLIPCWMCDQQIRTAFVLKRRWPPGLHKEGTPPRFRARNRVYDLVENTSLRKHEKVDIILTSYVEGYGKRGDVINVKPTLAYNSFILPGLGVYSSPENIEKYSVLSQTEHAEKHSSPFAAKVEKFLSIFILSVVMNKEISWTLEPWHISMSFRKAGIIVPEKAITMPKYPIKGPDLSLEEKVFLVKVTINNLETALVRCRIHHWSTALADRLPYAQNSEEQKFEPIFPEEAAIIEAMSHAPLQKPESLSQ